ncbi:MAG: LEPR-XLL domain-containing protein [Hungatella hathewayi]|nr:LEPR-XLL domain-containing protein [Hungatella hathewayi]
MEQRLLLSADPLSEGRVRGALSQPAGYLLSIPPL